MLNDYDFPLSLLIPNSYALHNFIFISRSPCYLSLPCIMFWEINITHFWIYLDWDNVDDHTINQMKGRLLGLESFLHAMALYSQCGHFTKRPDGHYTSRLLPQSTLVAHFLKLSIPYYLKYFILSLFCIVSIIFPHIQISFLNFPRIFIVN